jgi:PAS domain S-box-containing protein
VKPDAIHPLLTRQLRKLGLQPGVAPDAAAFAALMARVSAVYADVDQERYVLERSQDIASREMVALNGALRSSQARFASLLSLSSDWVWEQDLNARFTHVSDDMALRGKLDSSSLLGQACSVEGALRVSAEDDDRVRRLMAGREPFHDLTFEVDDGRGGRCHMRISGEPVFEGGLCMGYRGVGSDVSATVEADRRTQELARRRLEAQLDFTSRLLEVSPTPFFVKDERGRFTTVNRAWLDLMALDPQEVIGRTSNDVFGLEAPLHVEQDQRLMQSEEAVSYENHLLRPGREPRDTVVTKLRFTNADGSPAGIIGSIIDVTEFRNAERATREARDAAERATRAKSDFIANVSHELRTPLQSIIGFSELGLDRETPHPRWRDMLRNIQAGGQRMLRLVNDLLDISKVDDKSTRLNFQPHDLVALTAEVIRELQPLADRRQLRLELGPDQPTMPAEVDAFRMQQVLRNVLANALRFAPVGSAIEIGCRPVAPAGAVLTIRDHGPGIPEAELDAIFEAFVQSSLTSDGSGGTGLGLTLCRKIMAAHGGRIRADNAPGGGALMTLELPSRLVQADTAVEAA